MATGDSRITNFDLVSDKVGFVEGATPVAQNRFQDSETNKIIDILLGFKANLSTSKADQNLRIADTPTHKNIKFADAATAATALDAVRVFPYVLASTNELVFVTAAQFAALLALKTESPTLHSLTGGTPYVYTLPTAYSSVDDYNITMRSWDSNESGYDTFVDVKCKRENDKITFIADADCTLFLVVKSLN